MNISSPHRSIDATAIPPERLAGAACLSEKEKLGAACQQFEAVLLRQVLEQSMKPLFASALVRDSAVSGIYRDWMTSSIADEISHSRTLGLATVFEKQLSPREQTTPSTKTESK